MRGSISKARLLCTAVVQNRVTMLQCNGACQCCNAMLQSKVGCNVAGQRGNLGARVFSTFQVRVVKVFFPSSAASMSTSIANANAALKVLASQAKAVDGTCLAFDEVVDKRSIGSGNVG